MNKYEIIGIVGEGAYGVVYKAKHKETGEFGKFYSLIVGSRDQEVQGVRRGRDRQEDHHARGQDAQNAQTQQYCPPQRGLQEVLHYL